MSIINFGNSITLQQAADLIVSTPENRYLLQGEPGIGKSSIMGSIRSKLPSHLFAYIDVPNTDLGDVAMPAMDHEKQVTRYYPNSRFNLHLNKPVVIMLDEFTKGAEPVKNMFHPMLETHNPRLGDLPIHKDSIVFLTGNMGSDGVGDQLKAHTRNRIVPVQVHKPTADEWLGWAVNNDVDGVVMAWVNERNQVLASYMDEGEADNEYIFNPKKVQTAYVSPRSLERASNIIKARDKVDSDTLICALTGAIGESGSRDLQAYLTYQQQIPKWEDIIEAPKKAKVPDSAGASYVLIFNAIAKISTETITPFMEYLKRLEPEFQATFCINIAKNPQRQTIAFAAKAFSEWVQENEDLL